MADDSINYKELYFTMMQETEKAVSLLIAAQQKCEEAWLEQTEHALEDRQDIRPTGGGEKTGSGRR